MRRAGPVLALLLVALVDAVVLSGVAWNRHGEAESSLMLTERELPIGYTDKENTGMWLRIDLAGGSSRWLGTEDDSGVRPAWSSPERLTELGFDCSVPVTDPRAEAFYDKALPLERYAVLEYDGESWRSWQGTKEREIDDLARKVERGEVKAQVLEAARDGLESERLRGSRLFLVDVGRDPAELRRRYPDRSRHIVAGTIVRLWLRRPWDPRTERSGDLILEAFAPDLLVTEIHVPHHLRPLLETIRREDRARRENAMRPGGTVSYSGSPRYAVTLKYGRRHEPWIADVRPLEVSATNYPPR